MASFQEGRDSLGKPLFTLNFRKCSVETSKPLLTLAMNASGIVEAPLYALKKAAY